MKKIYWKPEAEQISVTAGSVLADSVDLPTDEEFED